MESIQKWKVTIHPPPSPPPSTLYLCIVSALGLAGQISISASQGARRDISDSCLGLHLDTLMCCLICTTRHHHLTRYIYSVTGMFWLESNGVLCLPGLIMSGLVNCSQFVAPCKQQADGEKVEGGEGGTEGGGGGEDGMPQLLLLKVNVWPEFWAFLLLSLVQLTACQAEKYFQFFSPHYTVTIWLISSMGNIEAPLTLRQTEAGLCLISTTSNWPTTSPLHIRQHFDVLWCRKLVQIIKMNFSLSLPRLVWQGALFLFW